MVKLPDQWTLGSRDPQPSMRSVSVPDSPLPAAFARLGDTVQNIGAQLAQDAAQQRSFEQQARFLKFEQDWQNYVTEAQRTAQPGAAGFSASIDKEYESRAREFFKDVPAEQRGAYDLKLVDLRNRIQDATTKFELGERDRYSIVRLGEGQNTLLERMRQRPESWAEIEREGEGFINASTLPENEKQAQLDAWRKRRARVLVETDSAVDPLGTRARLMPSRVEEDAYSLIRRHEGFRDSSYWDVNAHRIGYGSDTITRADGTVQRVGKGSRISRADAERDLVRRVSEFQSGIIRDIGGVAWESMGAGQRAALTSVAYNYGSLPKTVVAAIRSGGDVASAIEGLSANRGRRRHEAQVYRGSAKVGASGPDVLGSTPDQPGPPISTATVDGRYAALPVEERMKLAASLDKQIEDARKREEHAAFVSGLVSGQRFMDVYNPDERKIVDDAVDDIGLGASMVNGDPAAIQEGVTLAQRLGYVPKTMFSALRTMGDSQDATSREMAYQAAVSILHERPNAFNALEGGKGFADDARTFQHYVDDRNMSPQQAIKRIDELKAPENRRLIEARRKEAKAIADKIQSGDITDIFDTWLTGEPGLGPTPNDEIRILANFREAFEEHYGLTGDETLARKLALNEIRRTLGPSTLFGRNMLMNFPPEGFYEGVGIEGERHRYIEEQAVADVKAVTGKDIDPGNVYLIPDARTRREAERHPKAPVSYGLMYMDENGVLQMVPGRFIADPKTAREAFRKQMDEERARALGEAPTPVPQALEPIIPEATGEQDIYRQLFEGAQ